MGAQHQGMAWNHRPGDVEGLREERESLSLTDQSKCVIFCYGHKSKVMDIGVFVEFGVTALGSHGTLGSRITIPDRNTTSNFRMATRTSRGGYILQPVANQPDPMVACMRDYPKHDGRRIGNATEPAIFRGSEALQSSFTTESKTSQDLHLPGYAPSTSTGIERY
ncbi:hypothetical protein JZ751_021551 [Albula glossodonta]|uniref:Uncharacterized protein n=1 Tax=Albula glossodonta TaxID=121402 RepID=A0A8T2NSB9_9TELE|nr:hypothetical protein JZ751_021551 [Albula glossodonta]